MAQELKLGNDITSVSWNGWVIRGKDTNHLIVEMIAKLNLSYRQIAKIFNVSYQTIANRVWAFREQYPDEWLEVESKEKFYKIFKDLYYKHDTKLSIVASKLGISINKARHLRAQLIPREERIKKVSIKARQNILCHALFGFEYNTNDNFEENLKEWFKKIAKEPRKRLIDYYLNGEDTTLDERRQRMYDIDLVRQWLIENNIETQELINKEIICQNRKL